MITIYHNPRCSKSRACLEILQQAALPLEVVEYLRQPPSLELLGHFARLLGLKALVRDNEALYKSLNLAEADEETILKALENHPQLLQRPIVVVGERILIARPPEKVLELVHG